MRFFRSTPASPFSADWTYSVEGLLWSMRLTEEGCFILEERHPELKTVRFHAVDECTGQARWDPLQLEEPWWVGIEDVMGGTLYLHLYRKPDMPEHRGIIAIAMDSGAERWRREDLTFVAAAPDRVLAVQDQFSGRVYSLLDPYTGKTREELGSDTTMIQAMRDGFPIPDLFAECRYPTPVSEAGLTEATQALVLRHLPASEIWDAPEVLAVERWILAGWHRPETQGGEFSQHFGVFDAESGKELFHDILIPSTPTPNVDSFFMKGRWLYYTKNMSQLVAHALPGGSPS